MEGSVPGDGLCDGGVRRLGFTHVADNQRSLTASADQLVDRLLPVGLVSVDDHDLGSLCDEEPGGGLTKTRRSAGHNGYFAREPVRHLRQPLPTYVYSTCLDMSGAAFARTNY